MPKLIFGETQDKQLCYKAGDLFRHPAEPKNYVVMLIRNPANCLWNFATLNNGALVYQINYTSAQDVIQALFGNKNDPETFRLTSRTTITLEVE